MAASTELGEPGDEARVQDGVGDRYERQRRYDYLVAPLRARLQQNGVGDGVGVGPARDGDPVF
jgi:hypothetical protein